MVGVCVRPELYLLESKGKVVAGCCHIYNGSVCADKADLAVLNYRFNVDFNASDAEVELLGESVAEKFRLLGFHQSESYG